MALVRGYLAMSLDGFIAGPNDELSWLQEPRSSGLRLATGDWAAADSDGLEFDDFLAGIGCIVMGRRTYDVVVGFGGDWQYGDTPMLIVTSRPLDDDRESVTAISGDIHDVIARAKAIAGDKDVYIDGGRTIRSALDAGEVDHLVATVLPTALGAGIPLFTGLEGRAEFAVEKVSKWGPGMVQLHLTTRH